MSLLTLTEAIDHLRQEPGFDDEGILRKSDEASDIVLDYVTHADKSTWTDETAPGVIKAAAKLVLTQLYDDRSGDPLTRGVKDLLRRYRDPSLA